jgi:hypothetical protein
MKIQMTITPKIGEEPLDALSVTAEFVTKNFLQGRLILKEVTVGNTISIKRGNAIVTFSPEEEEEETI